MEDNKQKVKVIDLRVIFKKIKDNRKLFYKVLPTVFVLSCLFIITVPRYYVTDTKLAPEIDNPATGGSLGALASSFGIDLGNIQSSDAITPLLYPDLLDDNGFIASLMNIRVKSQDGSIDTNYHDYLKLYQKKGWWMYPITWVTNILPKKNEFGSSKDDYSPYYLNRKENGILNKARKNIKIDLDKKTNVITIQAKAQDALICKTLADSVKEKLQAFITKYRTSKARTDYEYYKGLVDDAKQEYEKARKVYGGTADANTRVALRSVELRLEDMENDMQLKYNAYSALSSQLQAAKAKVQERTPAFTLLKGAAVPVKPTGPKRMLFVLGMVILAFIVLSVYSIRDYIFNE